MPGSASRVLVVGATGELGTHAVHGLMTRGSQPAVAGRDPGRLDALAERTGCPALAIDAYDLDGCAGAAAWAAAVLGGLDGVLVAVGVPAFGTADSVPDAVAEHLMTVNALCPMAVLRGAIPVVRDGGFLAAITGAIVETPLTGAADYAAAKSALSCWLTVVSREVRRRDVQVTDARLPHMATGFESRGVYGSPPRLPPGADPATEVAALLDRLLGHLSSTRRQTPSP
ncbi:SDR family NAD(P)-dependent oxidoreductase [Streptomyces sp. NPDC006656]|uniref:SDR family NAD(P)-dependent oxidoreductase n=1 Tax=Streptomyces sp. NPDC006656 TaxID=3156899 RepID=UPI003453B5BC